MKQAIEETKKMLNDLAEAVNQKLFDGCREWYWVGDMIGGMCCFDDTDYLKVEDMILIFDKDVDYETYAEWRNAELDNPNIHINLHSWLMGARHEMRKPTIDDLYDELKEVREHTERIFNQIKKLKE